MPSERSSDVKFEINMAQRVMDCDDAGHIQAGRMLRNKPGLGCLSYQPIPKPSPLVGVLGALACRPLMDKIVLRFDEQIFQ